MLALLLGAYPAVGFGLDLTGFADARGGMLPELLRDAVDDADLEPLFRSAEAYVSMWEKAEAYAEGRKR